MNKQLRNDWNELRTPPRPMTDMLRGETDLEAMWNEWPVEPGDAETATCGGQR